MLQLSRVKVSRPRLPREFVRRSRLIEKLNAGLDFPLTVVSAPAGFGKTTLLVDWLESVSLPAAWLSLDESDNTLEFFATYLVTAIQTIFPGALSSVFGMLSAPVSQDPSRLALELGNALAELPEEFILVLDDYHLIRAPDVEQMMSRLVPQIPAPMHLVIATRYDVPLPLSKLHANGQLWEIRAAELRFTTAETHEFYARMGEPALSPEVLRVLDENSEGWATGIRFAALSLRAGTAEQELLKLARKPVNRLLIDYFLNEIFLRQPPATQEFLLKTSMLEHFTFDACEALLADERNTNWHAVFNTLAHDELILVVLDDNVGWYRYHHLFREFLQFQRDSTYNHETIVELHRRASRWHASQGFYTEAIQYALAAGDMACGAQLVGDHLHHDLDQEIARPLIERWLNFFPREDWDKHLGLVMAQLWVAALQFAVPKIARLVPLAEQRLEQAHDLEITKRKYYFGEISFMKLAIAAMANDATRGLELAPQALDNLPRTSVYARGSTLAFQAMCFQMTGNAAGGVSVLNDTLRNYEFDLPHFRFRVLLGLAIIQLFEADYGGLAETAETMLRIAQDKSYVTLGWAHYFLGVVHYEWNQLEAAAQHFAQGAELRFSANLKVSHESFARLALVQQARGLTDTANATMEQVIHFSDEMKSGELTVSSDAYRARLALVQGNLNAAIRWAETVSLSPTPHMLWDIEPHLTRLRALLAARKPNLTELALADTTALLETALALHNRQRAIQLYALQCLAREALGQTQNALDALQNAITLAEPGDFKRSFLDAGPGMRYLLNLLLARNVASNFISRILSINPEVTPGIMYPADVETAAPRLIEPLSMREMQVLEALAKRNSNKEIARSLVISGSTVKAHLQNIYAKLNVNNRQDAVQVALAYGLLQRLPEGAIGVR
jgi:LuxR family maltose regulon positive regulatory protein